MGDIYGKGGGSGFSRARAAKAPEPEAGALLKKMERKHTQIDMKPAEKPAEVSSTKVDEEEYG
jgi:hypothetical protein